MNLRTFPILVALLLLMGACFWIFRARESYVSVNPPSFSPLDSPNRQETTKPVEAPADAVSALLGMKQQEPQETPRKVLATYVTRIGASPFQKTVRYDKQPVSIASIPGYTDLVLYFTQRGRRLPSFLFRVDSETESIVENLGELNVNVISIKAYLDPVNGQTLAYDLAMSDGSVPQRTVGRLSPAGITIDIYRGDERVDSQEVKMPPKTSIIPVEMEFVHLRFLQQPDYTKPLRWVFFVPEISGFVNLVATPKGRETIPHRGSNRPSYKYEVVTSSTAAQTGVYARQTMWFDEVTDQLIKREDFETGQGAGAIQSLGTVTEFVTEDERVEPSPLQIQPPALAEIDAQSAIALFPFPLDQELIYYVTAKNQDMGRIVVKFKHQPQDKDGPEGYLAETELKIGQSGSRRSESATTRFDKNFLPISYRAMGEELTDVQSTYRLDATFGGGTVRVQVDRATSPLKVEEEQRPQRKSETSTIDKPLAEIWQPPLRPVSLAEENREAADPVSTSLTGIRKQELTIERKLQRGVLIYDFNRVEHLIAALWRFLPKTWPASDENQPVSVERRLAFYSVRRNQAAVPVFKVVPESRPAADEQITAALKDRIYLVHTGGALMPSSMLLAGDGRLLQWSSYYGSSEVTYTLDDPIMHARRKQAQQRRVQEGPRLIRPPWF